jgi:hypothetical protein
VLKKKKTEKIKGKKCYEIIRSNFRQSGSEFIILRMHMMTENGTFLRTKSASLVVIAQWGK